jgi:hypothetical protein
MENPSSGFERVSIRGLRLQLSAIRQESASYASALRISGVLLVAVLFIGRRPDSLFHAQFWAEDGPIFYFQALKDGAFRSLFEQYSGYLHIIPRLTAIVAVQMPPIFAPLIFSAVAFGFAIYACSMFSSVHYRSIVRSDLLRVLLCCAFAVVPPADELIGTLTDLHYYLFLLIFLQLVGLSANRENRGNSLWKEACGALVSLVATASAPEAVLLLPIAGWQLARSGKASSRLIPIGVVIGAVVQLGNLLTSAWQPASRPMPFALFFTTVVAFVHRVVISSIAGQVASASIVAHGAQGLVLALIMLLTGGFIALWMRLRDREPRALVFALLGSSVAFVAIMIYTRDLWGEFPSLAQLVDYNGSRHFIVPIFFFLLAAAVAVESLLRDFKRYSPAIAFLIIFVCGGALNYRVMQFTDYHWSDNAPLVDRWRSCQRHHEPCPSVTIPINPPGFNFTLPANP